MTTDKNELIRYPVSVKKERPWAIIDATGMRIATVSGHKTTQEMDNLRAAEIVRVLNAYHEQCKESQAMIESVTAPKPKCEPASGEPSPQAMRIATKWIVSGDKSKIRELARGCDIEFADERAEAAEKIKALQERGDGYHTAYVRKDASLRAMQCKLTAAGRERDEAVRCGLNDREEFTKTNIVAWNRALTSEARVTELEAELAESQEWQKKHLNKQEQYARHIATIDSERNQLRADLDEAVACLENIHMVRDSREKVKDLLRIYFTSKPSEPGNCSGVPNSSDAAPPETATASGDAYSGWRDRRDELGRRVRDTWVRWAQDQLYTKPSWVIPYDEISEADKEVDRQIGEDIAVFVELQAQATIVKLRTQLAERDAEIAQLTYVLTGVQQIIHSSSASEVV